MIQAGNPGRTLVVNILILESFDETGVSIIQFRSTAPGKEGIGVKPAFQHMGIGSCLLKACLNRAALLKRTIYLETYTLSNISINFCIFFISDPSFYDRHLNINTVIKNYNISIFTCNQ